MKYYFLLLIIALGINCTDHKKQNEVKHFDTLAEQLPKDAPLKIIDSIVLCESFVDSNLIGIKGHHKIQIERFANSDTSFMQISFFEKSNKNWVKKQSFGFDNGVSSGSRVELSDFNNDGINDLTYKSALAARSANDIRKLFIFDRSKKQLVYIKNSEEYPNLKYNKELDCLDAFFVYGGCATVFVHLKKDSLITFATVELDDKINVWKLDNKGDTIYFIKERPNNIGTFVRCANYHPIKINKNF